MGMVSVVLHWSNWPRRTSTLSRHVSDQREVRPVDDGMPRPGGHARVAERADSGGGQGGCYTNLVHLRGLTGGMVEQVDVDLVVPGAGRIDDEREVERPKERFL